MKIISTNRQGRNEYLVFSTRHQVLFQVNVESAAAELQTVTDALAFIRTQGIKACVEREKSDAHKRTTNKSKDNISLIKTLLKQLNTSIRARMLEISVTYCDDIILVQTVLMSIKSPQCIFEKMGIGQGVI